MAQVFNSIDLRRQIFNFKSQNLKQDTKKNYDKVLHELKCHWYMAYEARNGMDLAYNMETVELDEEQIYNLTENEFHDIMLHEWDIGRSNIYCPYWSSNLIQQIEETDQETRDMIFSGQILEIQN